MSDKSELLQELQRAIMAGEGDAAKAAAQACLDAGVEPEEAVEAGVRQGLHIVGEKFENFELFLPDMILAAETSEGAMEVLEPAIAAKNAGTESSGTVVIGTAKGDIHTIGKNIVAMLFRLDGYVVHDLGEDTSAVAFLEEAQKSGADIIAISALLTATIPGQREVISLLNEVGERDKYVVLVGGAPVTQEWADEIGADGFSTSAAGGVRLAGELLAKRKGAQ